MIKGHILKLNGSCIISTYLPECSTKPQMIGFSIWSASCTSYGMILTLVHRLHRSLHLHAECLCALLHSQQSGSLIAFHVNIKVYLTFWSLTRFTCKTLEWNLCTDEDLWFFRAIDSVECNSDRSTTVWLLHPSSMIDCFVGFLGCKFY